MFENAYGKENINQHEVETLFNDIKVSFSPAKLQNHLLKYKGHPEKALENISMLRLEPQTYEEDRTTIYRFGDRYNANWMPFGSGKQTRPWDTIVTQDNIKEQVLNDLSEFLSSKELYVARGITHRKGYVYNQI